MRICFVGDSFVSGFGDKEGLGWSGRLIRECWSRGHEITHYNLGIRRDTSEQIRSRWKTEVDRRLPEDTDGRIVFSFGTNDTTIENGKRRVEYEKSVENVARILSEAKAQYPTLMVGPPPILDSNQNERTRQLDRDFSRKSKELNASYLSVFKELMESKIWENELRDLDGAHPQGDGYRVLAKLVGSWKAWRQWFSNS